MFAVLALAGTAAAYANATTTVETTNYVTIPCSTPTTFSYGSKTYTVTEATTLTVEDCSCTDHYPGKTAAASSEGPKPSAPAPAAGNHSAPAVVNGAVAGKVGAAAGVAAAVAYLL